MSARYTAPTRAVLRLLGRRLVRDRRGVAAVEFAFVLPILLVMYFGLVEITQGLMISRKAALLTRSLADLTAQATTVSDTERDIIFSAAVKVMEPFKGASDMSFTSIVIDANGAAKVCWSEKKNGGTSYATGSSITVPASLRIPKTSLIMAKSSYKFDSVLPTFDMGTTRIGQGAWEIGGDAYYMRPRKGKFGGTSTAEQVERTGKPLC